MDFPIKNGGSFHSKLSVHQAGYWNSHGDDWGSPGRRHLATVGRIAVQVETVGRAVDLAAGVHSWIIGVYRTEGALKSQKSGEETEESMIFWPWAMTYREFRHFLWVSHHLRASDDINWIFWGEMMFVPDPSDGKFSAFKFALPKETTTTWVWESWTPVHETFACQNPRLILKVHSSGFLIRSPDCITKYPLVMSNIAIENSDL